MKIFLDKNGNISVKNGELPENPRIIVRKIGLPAYEMPEGGQIYFANTGSCVFNKGDFLVRENRTLRIFTPDEFRRLFDTVIEPEKKRTTNIKSDNDEGEINDESKLRVKGRKKSELNEKNDEDEF